VQEFAISDGQRDIASDAHVQRLQPGQRVLVRAAQAKDGAVFQVWVNHHNAGAVPYSAVVHHSTSAAAAFAACAVALLQLLGPQALPRGQQ
jgi:hypothetical protein